MQVQLVSQKDRLDFMPNVFPAPYKPFIKRGSSQTGDIEACIFAVAKQTYHPEDYNHGYLEFGYIDGMPVFIPETNQTNDIALALGIETAKSVRISSVFDDDYVRMPSELAALITTRAATLLYLERTINYLSESEYDRVYEFVYKLRDMIYSYADSDNEELKSSVYRLMD